MSDDRPAEPAAPGASEPFGQADSPAAAPSGPYDPSVSDPPSGQSVVPDPSATGPYPPPPTAPRKSRKALLLGLVAGAAVVLIVAAAVVVAFAVRGGGAPKATVQAYLKALSNGQAADALAQGPTPPDRRYLTDDALAQQNKIAKISDIVVDDGRTSGGRAQVHATYRYGDKRADEYFSLTKRNGDWKLDATVYPVDVTSIQDIPGLTLMGVRADGVGKAYVFPGPLVWGTSNKYFAVKEQDAAGFAVSPTDGAFSYSTLKTDLSDAGQSAVTDAVDTFVKQCAAMTSLEPSGCPQKEFDFQAVDGSAQWTPPSDLRGLQYQSGTIPTEITVAGSLTWSVNYQARDFNGNVTGKTDGNVDSSVYGMVDLSASPPTFAAQ